MRSGKWRWAFLAGLFMVWWICPALAEVPEAPEEFYFLDQANVLTEHTKGEIFFSNQLLNGECGAQIVVVTTPSTGEQPIKDYTFELFNRWGIGDRTKNNGFLLVLAIDDKDYFAMTGAGLDSRLTREMIIQYFNQYLEKDFAAGQYDAGVRKFFEAVFSEIAGIYGAKATTNKGMAAYHLWKLKTIIGNVG